MAPLRVLITNDDGPPGRESPFIFGLFQELRKLGWDLKVVIPSSQKSWIGKAYQIKDVIKGRYYYPREPDGLGESSEVSRPLKEGEVAEWILLDGTPATCTNIALHNMYPSQIDLVVSGPNFGRNTSSAFALSSGTIGAALSSSLSLVRSIALSYGVFHHPSPPSYVAPAQALASKIIQKLWGNWGKDEVGLRNGEVDLYNVNIPLVPELLSEEGMEVAWTTIWRNRYHRLFKPQSPAPESPTMSAAGPDAPSSPPSNSQPADSSAYSPLTYHFSPQMGQLVNPPMESLPEGTDSWTVHHGKASVTPLRATFAEPGQESWGFAWGKL